MPREDIIAVYSGIINVVNLIEKLPREQAGAVTVPADEIAQAFLVKVPGLGIGEKIVGLFARATIDLVVGIGLQKLLLPPQFLLFI